MWVSGSLIRSSTWRSSSVSAPCISSSICLPSSPERSRTMRGSFCQALPIGCIRVFMTPSCSSAVTLESRCSGTLNSVSSLRREISRSWLRVSTSSETMVIRCSSVSTLTRIDWLAILSASWTSAASATAAFRAGLAFASFAAGGAGAASGAALFGDGGRRGLGRGFGLGLAEGAFEVVERDFAGTQRAFQHLVHQRALGDFRGHRGRNRRCGHRPGAASTASSAWLPPSAIACSFSIRSSSVPSGSVSVASRPARISLMRSIEDRISVTASALTGMPSRNLPISVSPAWASASSRGKPRKPQVPLMVCTRRKMLSKIFASLGSCSNRTN